MRETREFVLLTVSNNAECRAVRLLEAVAKAGSWSNWMGVFDRGWMALLQAASSRVRGGQKACAM